MPDTGQRDDWNPFEVVNDRRQSAREESYRPGGDLANSRPFTGTDSNRGRFVDGLGITRGFEGVGEQFADGGGGGGVAGWLESFREQVGIELQQVWDTSTLVKKLGTGGPYNARRSSRLSTKFGTDGYGSRPLREPSRGYIKTEDPAARTVWYLHFMWNPTTVNYGYAFSEEYNPSEQTPEQQSISSFVTGSQIGFFLVFDRSQELAQGARQRDRSESGFFSSRLSGEDGSLSPQRVGVLHDLIVLDRIVSGTTEYTGAGAAPGVLRLGQQSRVVFSPRLNSTSSTGLSFNGWCSSVDVDITRFSWDMVPMTATVSISFARSLVTDSSHFGTDDDTSFNAAPVNNTRRQNTTPTLGVSRRV